MRDALITRVVGAGEGGIVIFSGRTPVLAITLHLVDGTIEAVHVVSNPEKLAGVVL